MQSWRLPGADGRRFAGQCAQVMVKPRLAAGGQHRPYACGLASRVRLAENVSRR